MASLPAPTFEGILKSIKEKKLAPVYLLHGEEGYYIDELAKAFEGLLSEDEKVFNEYILYAPQVEPGQVMDVCRGVPMMADRQVVILKEAQAIRSDKLNKLYTYVADPNPTTVLVICCRGAAAKGKDLMAALKKCGAVVFESKKVAEYNAPAVVGQYIRKKGVATDQKALEMLCNFVGTDLSRLYNEVDKLASLLPPGGAITPELVERHVGVSREYNSFELVDALAARDAEKVFRIANYFRSNPKAAPLVMVLASIYNLFSDLLIAYYTPGGSDQAIAEALGLRNTFGLKRIRTGMSNYNPFQIIEIIGAIRAFDVQSKGVESRRNEHDLFHELMYHIISAPGRL